jgi:hypothetical protein
MMKGQSTDMVVAELLKDKTQGRYLQKCLLFRLKEKIV